MRRGTNTYEIYPFPYMEDVFVGIRVLTHDEIMRASNIGREKANKSLTNANEDEQIKFASREILFNAVVKATNDTECSSEAFFSNAEEVGELTLDEINLLLEHYNEVQQKFIPQQDLNSPEEFDALIEDLKKKPQIGMSLSTYTLRMVLLYSVARLQNLQKDSDSISSSASPSKVDGKETLTKPVEKRGIKLTESNS